MAPQTFHCSWDPFPADMCWLQVVSPLPWLETFHPTFSFFNLAFLGLLQILQPGSCPGAFTLAFLCLATVLKHSHSSVLKRPKSESPVVGAAQHPSPCVSGTFAFCFVFLCLCSFLAYKHCKGGMLGLTTSFAKLLQVCEEGTHQCTQYRMCAWVDWV